MTGQAIITPFLAASLAGADFLRARGFFEQLFDELATPESLPLTAMALLLVAATMAGAGRARFVFGLLAWALPFAIGLTQGTVNAIFMFWLAILILVNLFQLFRAASRKRKGLQTAEEQSLIAEVLSIEEPAKQRRLRDVITWRDAEAGEVLIRQGQIAPPLIYIATGTMEIEHEGLPVGTCGPDDFIGEMSLISGEGASATVKVAMRARIAVFDRDGLVRLSRAMPELSRALDRTLNRGLSAKIQRMNKASSEKWNIGS